MFKRFFNTAGKLQIQKTSQKAVKKQWIDTNSYKNFKEYRLKMVNQSPLKKELFKKYHQAIN